MNRVLIDVRYHPQPKISLANDFLEAELYPSLLNQEVATDEKEIFVQVLQLAPIYSGPAADILRDARANKLIVRVSGLTIPWKVLEPLFKKHWPEKKGK